MCLLARSNVPLFSTKMSSVIILKITTFEGEIWLFFHEIYFPYKAFVSYIFNKEFSFQKYIEMELKIFTIFRMVKTKHGNSRPLFHEVK